MSLDTEFSDRVDMGAAYLDKTRPGWFEKIDTSTLTMRSLENCILGQLFGDFSLGLDILGMSLDMAFGMGFDLQWDEASSITWALLEIAWIDEINLRVAQTL